MSERTMSAFEITWTLLNTAEVCPPELYAMFQAMDEDKRLGFVSEISRLLEQEAEAGSPDDKRGWWGDKNACRICGKYGHSTIAGSWVPVCREHKAWWDTEWIKFHPPTEQATP